MDVVTLALWATLALPAVQEPPGDGRIYGRVHTAAGAVHEGYLRWDRNEGSWSDLLDGSKELPWQNFRDAERLDEEYGRLRARERSIEVLGLRITWDEDDEALPDRATSGIRFGHLRSLRVRGRDRALLTLKSGLEVELVGGSTDLGNDLRGLEVEYADGGSTELRWRDLDEVVFMEAPASAAAPRAGRLHGTVRTEDGLEFTGWIAWDTDEILTSDVLDGRQDGRDREIPFERIAAIERATSSSARVILRDGEEMLLRGSNDVNAQNRGIAVSDPGLGQVLVGWREFESVRFHPPARTAASYASFDGGRALFGTVDSEQGTVTGRIRWDNDEEATWEMLDGRLDGIELKVELGLVRSIERRGLWGVEATLLDGRVLELERSNDVDERNKGIFVTLDDGEMVLVRWRDFVRATFSAP